MSYELPSQALNPGSSPTFTGLTLSGLTQGSVPFAGAGGVLSQDNANFFWDATNHRLGIGTAVPGSKIDVEGGPGVAFGITASGTTLGPAIQLTSSGSGGRQYQIISTQASQGPGAGAFDIYDTTASLDRLTILPSGNIGIGNNKPSALLSIGTTAGSLGVNNTFTDAANYEVARFDWNVPNVLTIGTDKAGTGSTRNLQFVVGGVSKLEYGITASNGWYSSAPITTANAQSYLMFDSGGTARSILVLDNSNPDVLLLKNNQRGVGGTVTIGTGAGGAPSVSVNSSALVAFGPSVVFTSSFPAFMRSGTTFVHRLADNSADGPVQASNAIISNMPTSDPHVVGQLWNSSGTVHISAG